MKSERKCFYVYILINNRQNVMYVGYTEDLEKQIYFHKKKLIPGFTKKYNVDRLVYYESFSNKEQAQQRERQLKGYSRKKKNDLVSNHNPELKELCYKVKE